MHLQNKKAILLLDLHGSRFQECILKLLCDNNIEMLTIPAHSSHVLQPLDRVTFSLFKSELQKLKHKYNFEKPILERQALLLQLVYWALYSAFQEDHILFAFACVGVYPTN